MQVHNHGMLLPFFKLLSSGVWSYSKTTCLVVVHTYIPQGCGLSCRVPMVVKNYKYHYKERPFRLTSVLLAGLSAEPTG